MIWICRGDKNVQQAAAHRHILLRSFLCVAARHFTQKRSPQYVRVSGTLGILIMHLKIITIIVLVTAVLAAFNAYQEELVGVVSYLVSVFGALLGSILCLLAYTFVLRKFPYNARPFLWASYAVAILGLIAYLNYALNGKADSLNTAGHMHVIVFPLLHIFISICLQAFCIMWVAGQKVLARKRGANA